MRDEKEGREKPRRREGEGREREAKEKGGRREGEGKESGAKEKGGRREGERSQGGGREKERRVEPSGREINIMLLAETKQVETLALRHYNTLYTQLPYIFLCIMVLPWRG